MCISTLKGIASSKSVSPTARVTAATALLDRGWGRPAQPVTGEDGEGPIVVQIIQKVREPK